MGKLRAEAQIWRSKKKKKEQIKFYAHNDSGGEKTSFLERGSPQGTSAAQIGTDFM